MTYMKPFPVFALRCEQLRVISYLVVIHMVTSNKKGAVTTKKSHNAKEMY